MFLIYNSFFKDEQRSSCSKKKSRECAGYECLQKYVDKPDERDVWNDTRKRLHGLDSQLKVGWTGYVLNFTSCCYLYLQDMIISS